MQFTSSQQDMLAAGQELILGTRVTLHEELQTLNHLVKIGRVHGLQRNTNDGLAQHGDTCKVDSAFTTTAQCSRLQNLALQTTDAKDAAGRN
ncbi:hypothetical protein HG531_007412 [Fusarium graminearum]|nr:hypothetical protein HG531_007412 [Fusarium graminearum]